MLSSPGKMIEEPYEITGIAQPETIRHKRDLWTFIELSLRIKKKTLGDYVATCITRQLLVSSYQNLSHFSTCFIYSRFLLSAIHFSVIF